MAKTNDFMGTFREIDDAPLPPHHKVILYHILRRGICTENTRQIAKATDMSLGKCSQVLRELRETGWLTDDIYNGREGLKIGSQTPSECSPHEQNVHHMNNECSPHEQNVHHMNKSVHVVNTHNRKVNNLLNNQECVHTHAPELPKHLQGFNAMWQESLPPQLVSRAEIIKRMVRNPADIENIQAAAALSLDLGITDQQLFDWFAPNATYWFTISHGRKDKLPPYAKNILSELAGALAWSAKPAPAPTTSTPTSPNEEFFTAF
jgi:hypothetical protein